MEEGDADWERAHLRVEGNSGERHRLGESALDRRRGLDERDANWKRPHLRVEGNGGQRCRLGESALESGRE